MECSINKFRAYLNLSNAEVAKKFSEINRDPKAINKFILVLEAVKTKIANKTQYNWELDIENGSVYAIKVDQHRFYSLQVIHNGYRELFICRYGKKESQQNTKKLTAVIESIGGVTIQKMLS